MTRARIPLMTHIFFWKLCNGNLPSSVLNYYFEHSDSLGFEMILDREWLEPKYYSGEEKYFSDCGDDCGDRGVVKWGLLSCRQA